MEAAILGHAMEVWAPVLFNCRKNGSFEIGLLFANYYNIIHLELFEFFDTCLTGFQPVWKILILGGFIKLIRKIGRGVHMMLEHFANKTDRFQRLLVFDHIRFVFVGLADDDTKHFMERLGGWILIFGIERKRNFLGMVLAFLVNIHSLIRWRND